MFFGLGLLQTSAIALCLLVGTSGGAYVWGYERGHRIAILEMQAANVKALTKAVEEARALQIAEDAITNEIGKHDAEARERIVRRTIIQIERVPVFITPKADAACQLGIGFVQLFDDAASDQGATLPEPASELVDAPSDVKLSEVSAAIIQNDGTYYQVREQLIDLQTWVIRQQALHP